MNLTTKKAFEKVIGQRGIHHQLGISNTALKQMRFKHKTNGVSLNRMEEILKLAGAKVVQEKLWELR